ncbi:MAG: ABC transporter ATP-binding protein [Lentisphaerae bacterium]|jgi:iron complex transport system ATP-binding protein|nr:ABC transporter ATP-binding protein [Lentisphaerota bacterium]
MTPGVLELRGIEFAYEAGGWALRIAELDLGREGLCAIVGPNGAGKSTLLEVAAGLRRPGRGKVRLEGKGLARMSRRAIARRLGYLPQECPALFDYTVAQVAAMGRHAHGGSLELERAADCAAVERALAAADMTALRRRRLSQLSGGERRRAWVAAALAQEPAILLLDEPTQALDTSQAAAIMGVLAERAAEGLRLVMVLHDLNLAALFCERVILMQAGQIAADGPPDAVLTEERLLAVYGRHLEVIRHPTTEKPVILAKK